MKILLAMFAVLVRLLRPTRGVHADPLGYVRGLAGEARRRRASRVRRYVQDLPVLTEPAPEPEPGADVVPVEEDVPVVPGPRRPADDVLSSRVGQWPGPVAEVDAAFGCLDGLLRAGAPSPPVWKVVPQAAFSVHEEVTELYDVVSEALRERGNVAVSRQALCAAGVGWGSLHEALCAGAPLPEPWRSH